MAKNPMLWHGPRRVEIQDVIKAHNLPCCDCGKKPTVRRLIVREGSGRRQVVTVYCMSCGGAWIRERRAEADRAVVMLEQGTGYIRL